MLAPDHHYLCSYLLPQTWSVMISKHSCALVLGLICALLPVLVHAGLTIAPVASTTSCPFFNDLPQAMTAPASYFPIGKVCVQTII
jgi:hypothetical protein